MLKFIKHHMASIGGIEIYPVLSFVIFFTVFLCAMYWALRADKKHIDKLEKLPFEND